MTRTKITVVVCTTGTRATLADALACLRRSLAAADAAPSDIIVVHNAEHASEELANLCHKAACSYLHQPVIGLSVARNTGVLACTSDLVAFIDDDILVSEGWAAAILDGFRDDPKVQVVTGPVIASREGNAAGVDWADLYRIPFITPTTFDSACDIPFFPLTVGFCGTGNNMAFRTKFLLTDGLFDSVFGLGSRLPGGEEIDRFYAVVHSGGKIHFTPAASVEHLYAEDGAALREKVRGYAAAQAGLLLKWCVTDRPMRSTIIHYILSRAKAVIRRGPSDAPAGRMAPPRWPIILGTISGPFRYFESTIREIIRPTKTVSLSRVEQDGEKPRVLMLPYNSGLGGAETICHTLAAELHTHVQVVVPEAGQMAASLRAGNIPVHVVPRSRLRLRLNPLPHLMYLARFRGTVAAYERVIRAASPDVVHLDSILNLPAMIAAQNSGARVLLHLQEVPNGILRRTLADVALRMCDRIVAVSDSAAAPLKDKIKPGRLAVVHNGTRVRSAAAYDCNGPISFIGRLSEDKGPLLFVRAAGRVFRTQPEAKFLICGVRVPGRERYESALASAISQTGIPAEHFEVLRDRENISEVLPRCSIVVNCSAVPESFGLSILEAMACARPVVAPASGAFPEFIEDGRTGLLYPPGNLDALVASILRLYRDTDLARRIGIAAHATVRDGFRVDQMAEAMEEQYRICIDQNRRRQVFD